MTFNNYVAALGMCRFSFFVFSFYRDFVINFVECFAFRAYELTKQLVLKNDSCPGRMRNKGWPSRGLGGITDGQKVGTRNEGTTF